MDESDLPSVPKVQETLPASTLTAPPPASSDSRPKNNSRGPMSQFNVYKAHSHNIQSAAMGAPDPYAEAGMSTTERQLQNLQMTVHKAQLIALLDGTPCKSAGLLRHMRLA